MLALFRERKIQHRHTVRGRIDTADFREKSFEKHMYELIFNMEFNWKELSTKLSKSDLSVLGKVYLNGNS